MKAYYENYGNEANPGEIIVVGDGEYLEADSSDKGISISWTSETALKDLLDIARRDGLLDGSTSDDSYLQICDDGISKAAEGPAEEVIDFITAKEPTVTYVSLKYDSLVLVWSAPAARVRWSKVSYPEIAVVVAATDIAKAEGLIRETGSETVRTKYPELISKVSQLALT